MTADRSTITGLFVRVCRDSGFRMDAIEAAKLTAKVLQIHPLDVWSAFSGLDLMDRIASGKHPVCRGASNG